MGKKPREPEVSIKEKGWVWVLLVRVVREDCTDKGMTYKEGPERRREHNAGNGEGD